MANRIKGLTIEIGGDTTKLDKALSGTNKEIKQTQSELKDVERLLKLDPKNTELLAQKQKLLSQGVEQTKTKLEELKRAEQQLKAAGVDENSSQFMALRREIIDTEQQMKGFSGETKTAAKNVKEVGDQTKAVEKLKDAAQVAAKAFAAMAAAAGGIVIGTVKGLADATKSAAEYADALITQSMQTGITTDKLQEYAYAAELVDVSVDTLTGAIARNIRSMKSAKEGSKSYADAYKKLGVSIMGTDGKLRNSEEVFWDIIEALGRMDNETERDSLAMTLLGKSAQDLNPLIKTGKDRMNELATEAHKLGVVMNTETLTAFAAYDDNLQKLSSIGTAIKNSFGSVLLPVLTSISTKGANLLGELSEKIQNADGDIEKIAAAFKEVIPKAVEAFKGDIQTVVKVVTDIVQAVADVVTEPSVLNGIIETVNTFLQAIVESVSKILPAFVSIIKAVLEQLPQFIEQILPPLLDLATDLINDVFLDPEFLAAFASAVVKSIEKVGQVLWEKYGTDLLLALFFPAGLGLKGLKSNYNDMLAWFEGDKGTTTYGGAGRGEGGGRDITNPTKLTPDTPTFNINFNGDLAGIGRVLAPSISYEQHRVGGGGLVVAK